MCKQLLIFSFSAFIRVDPQRVEIAPGNVCWIYLLCMKFSLVPVLIGLNTFLAEPNH